MKNIKTDIGEDTLDGTFLPVTFEWMINHLSNQANRQNIMNEIVGARTVEEQIEQYIKLIENTIKTWDVPGSK